MKNKTISNNLIVTFTMISCIVYYIGATDLEINYIPDPDSEWDIEVVLMIIELIQPDGAKIPIESIYGGENNPGSFQRMNGFTVIINKESGFWCWAYQNENGDLESTGYPAHLYDPIELGLEKNIRMSREEH